MTERLTEDYFDDMQKITRHYAKSNNIDLNTGGNDFQDIIDKPAEYETAEDEGRLLFLPCNPGITLYILRKKYTKCSKHNEEFDESSCCGCEDECDSRLFYYIVPCPDVTAEQILEFERLGALNKKIFFSKEEAEKALKEMEGK